MPGCWTLTVQNWHPTRLNAVRGRHWAVEHRAKRTDAAIYRFAAIVAGCPKATGRRRVRLEMGGWRTGKVPDKDAWAKVCLDALVRAGLLTDDGERGLEGQLEVVYHRGAKKWTRLILEDCPEEGA